MKPETTFDLESLREDIEATLGQEKIDASLRKKLEQAMIHESTSRIEDAYAYSTKKVKAVSGVKSTLLNQSTGNYDYEDYHPEDWRWKEDESPKAIFEQERRLRADKILDDIYPDLEEILETQRNAIIGAAKAFVTAELDALEKRIEQKFAQRYENRIKALEEKIEVMIHMQNDENFGRF